ncbi:hypothetical protein D9M70_587190 [compost metagenome]
MYSSMVALVIRIGAGSLRSSSRDRIWLGFCCCSLRTLSARSSVLPLYKQKRMLLPYLWVQASSRSCWELIRALSG